MGSKEKKRRAKSWFNYQLTKTNNWDKKKKKR